MEVLEHLAIDPCHAFREANRVLRPGGRLVLTTPNIVSYEALRKMLDLDSPYLFGIYSRNGVYGRHNREFTPWEVSGLGEACGFDTEVLTTRDVYPPSRDTGELIARFGDQLGPDELRHQNIFYRGIKTERAFAPYPDFLYDYDPDQHRARIAVSLDELTLSASDTLRGQARLTNLGGYTWEDQGENYTRLRIVLMSDQGAILDRRFRALILPRPVAPGETLEFTFEVPAPETSGDYRLRFDLVHEKVCWFSELRTRPVDLAVRVTA